MADEADLAEIQQQQALDRAISEARKNSIVNITNPWGRCWYCEEEIGKERRWCNADHRNRWSYENE